MLGDYISHDLSHESCVFAAPAASPAVALEKCTEITTLDSHRFLGLHISVILDPAKIPERRIQKDL